MTINLFISDHDPEAGSFGNVAAHEYGHLYGLQDRYAEGRTHSGTITGPGAFLLNNRQTYPLALPNMSERFGYDAFNNLYSAGDPVLTAYQRDVLFAINPNEQIYPAPFIFNNTGLVPGAAALDFDSSNPAGSVLTDGFGRRLTNQSGLPEWAYRGKGTALWNKTTARANSQQQNSRFSTNYNLTINNAQSSRQLIQSLWRK